MINHGDQVGSGRVHAHFSICRSPINMASLRVDFPSFSLLLLFSVVSSALGGVPVLLWESSNVSEKEDVVPALNQLDGDEFSSHLIKKVHTHKPLIVVFVEETLSVEDFSWKDDKHQGAFPKLENITGMAAKMEFIPSVIDPVGALKDLVHSQEYSYLKFDRSSPKNKPKTALEVALSDPFVTEDRPQLLRRHDADVTRIYSDLLASAPHIIAIFTGRQNSWVEADVNRVRRQVNNTEEALTWSPGGAMISAKSAKLTVKDKTYDLGAGEVKLDEREKTGLTRIIYSTVVGTEKTKIVLRIKFNVDKSTWNIGDSEVEVAGKAVGPITPTTKVSSPLDKSFSADSVTFESAAKDVTLVFSGFRAEKFRKAGQTTFSAAATSGNQFFTGPIWMGLLVTWTMLVILAWGIMMLMDIKTMDRFDDPKGKTITVNVTE